jgi:hypothetical protein
MFEDNWQPRDTNFEDTEGTVNNVGLKMLWEIRKVESGEAR